MNDKLVAEIEERRVRELRRPEHICDSELVYLLQRARDALPVWVPVSEVLPKGSGWYLVRIANYFDTAWYWDAQEEFDTGDEKLPKVTHWMPLPTPPTDKGDG